MPQCAVAFLMTKTELQKHLDKIYEQALIASKEKEIPVGACLITDTNVYYAHNQVEKSDHPFEHAEMLVIKEALKKENTRRLKNAVLIVSLEPCLMCMGALIKAGIKELYYVLDDPKLGALSHYHAFVDDSLIVTRVKDDRFEALMKDFFIKLRQDQL